jgi:hypothetical protein
MSESPLHAAAIELIPTASATTIRSVLQLLVNNLEPTAPIRTTPPPASAARPGRKRAPANGADAEWQQLRHQVRTTMHERAVDYADLAAVIGRSVNTLKISLSRRQPARAPVQAGLRAWLSTPAPEVAGVAEAGAPFRAASADRRVRNNGIAKRRDNGADAPAAATTG